MNEIFFPPLLGNIIQTAENETNIKKIPENRFFLLSLYASSRFIQTNEREI